MVRHGGRLCTTAFAAASRKCEVPVFEMDFCNPLQDPKQRHQPGDQAWATTLVMVDVAAQNPMCAALSTKSDENAYLSALCTAFDKSLRMRKQF